MVEYSEDYRATATATGESDSWESDSRASFAVGIPSEFGGSFDGPAPENYYAVALTNCFVATFKVMAENSNLDFERVVADGTLELRPDNGSTTVDSFYLDVELRVTEPNNKANVLIERTENHCFLLDSVGFDVTVDTDVVTT